MDQIDPYNVPELFRGVPRPKTDFQKSRFLAKNDSKNGKTRKYDKKRRLRPIAKAATAHCFEKLGHPEQVEQMKMLSTSLAQNVKFY